MNGGDHASSSAATSGPPPSLEWRFSQVFGERTAGEEVQEGNYCLRLIDCEIYSGVMSLVPFFLLDPEGI